jgi:hypothetical protein
MFAAKYRLHSIAKVFAIAGKDLSRPIKNESLKAKEALGQTEEKIYAYLNSIGISRKRDKKELTMSGIPFTEYNSIPRPDLAPLAKTFRPSF